MQAESYPKVSKHATLCPGTDCKLSLELRKAVPPSGIQQFLDDSQFVSELLAVKGMGGYCKCHCSICFHCQDDVGGHAPATCATKNLWCKIHASADPSVQRLEAMTVECPNCHRKVLKDKSACDHMTCVCTKNGRKFDFCYWCVRPWGKVSVMFWALGFIQSMPTYLLGAITERLRNLWRQMRVLQSQH